MRVPGLGVAIHSIRRTRQSLIRIRVKSGQYDDVTVRSASPQIDPNGFDRHK